MEEIIAKKEQTLKQSLNENYPFLSDLQIGKLLKDKSIKINDTRTKENVTLHPNDIVQVYFDFKTQVLTQNAIIEYDENIAIVRKAQGIEITDPDPNKYTLEKALCTKFEYAKAVHRLDLNTKGLIIFALNPTAHDELSKAIKEHRITKTYDAICYSKQSIRPATFKDYLKTDTSKGYTKITSCKDGKVAVLQILKASKITAKNVEKPTKTAHLGKGKARLQHTQESNQMAGQFPLYHLQILLVTGRTHQIRVQLAGHNIFILGDGKYGDKQVNRHYKKHKQYLQSSSIQFNFEENSPLYYLNKRTFSIPFSYDELLD